LTTNRILVAYATHAGSTAEVARVVGEAITEAGIQVDVLPIREVKSLSAYDAVVLGAPMIMGWHRGALRFLRKHRKSFEQIPAAVFVMAMSLTQTNETGPGGLQVTVDPDLPRLPARAGKLSLGERYARISNYARPILRAVPPASLAFFAGRLDYGRLKPWAVLFALAIVRASAGDRRNWAAIRAWAAGLPGIFQQWYANHPKGKIERSMHVQD
jgi:menaquinone-dependent protoporphyrinogen oxidase